MLNINNNNPVSTATAVYTLEQLKIDSEARRRNDYSDRLNLAFITIVGVAGVFFSLAN